MEVLERLLRDLQSSIETDDSNALDPHVIVDNIAAHALGELDRVDQEYASSLLLQSESPPSLLKILRGTMNTKIVDVKKARITALKFLATYVKVMGSSMEQFAAILFSSIQTIFKLEESNDVRASALGPLKNLLRSCQQVSDEREEGAPTFDFSYALSASGVVDVPSLLSNCMQELSNKKISAGLRSEILKVLGLLVGAYPDEPAVMKALSSLPGICMENLKKNFSGAVKPEFSVMAGSFSCLDRCFLDYERRLQKKQKTAAGGGGRSGGGGKINHPVLNCVDAPVLWEYLLKAVSVATSADATRFALTSKALRFIGHHASLFPTMIALHANATYTHVLACHKTGKKSIVKHSETALYAVLLEISSAVAQSCHSALGDASVVAGSPPAGQQQLQPIGEAATVLQKLCLDSLEQMMIYPSDTAITTTTSSTSVSTAEDGGGEQVANWQDAIVSAAVKSLAVVSHGVAALGMYYQVKRQLSKTALTVSDLDSVQILTSIIRGAQQVTQDREELAMELSSRGDTSSSETEGVLSLHPATANRCGVYLFAFASTAVAALQVPISRGELSRSVSTGSVLGSTQSLLLQSETALYMEKSAIDSIVAYSRLRPRQQRTIRSALCLTLQAVAERDRDHRSSIENSSRSTGSSQTVVAIKAGKKSKTKSSHDDDDSVQQKGSGSVVVVDISASELMDRTVSALLLRTLARTVDGEEAMFDDELIAAFQDGGAGSKDFLAISAHGSRDRLVLGYYSLWSELLHPSDKMTRRCLAIGGTPPASRAQTGSSQGSSSASAAKAVSDVVLVKKEEKEEEKEEEEQSSILLSSQYHRNVSLELYDKLMAQVLLTLRGLDLSYNTVDELNRAARATTDQPKEEGDNAGDDDENNEADVADSLIPNNIADQEVLISLVGFLELLLPGHCTDRFPGWCPFLMEEALKLAVAYPLVSPLYRLIACLMDTAASLPHFYSRPNDDAAALVVDVNPSSTRSLVVSDVSVTAGGEDSQKSTTAAAAAANAVIAQVRSYIASLVSGSLSHFHDELLSAALTMILSAPAEFVDLDTQLSAASLALRTGVEARRAVTAIYRALYRNVPLTKSEHVSTELIAMDSFTFKARLPELLPLLDTYLGASGNGSASNESGGEIALRTTTGLAGGGGQSSRSKKARDIVQLRLRLSSSVSDVVDCHTNGDGGQKTSTVTTLRTVFDAEEEDSSMQRAVTRLLGRLGGLNQMLLIEPTEAVQGSLSWGDTDSLVIKLPYPISGSAAAVSAAAGKTGKAGSSAAAASSASMDVSVALDHLLPRVTELCSNKSDGNTASSVDRQVQIAAAELLHGIITLMIGTAATTSNTTAKRQQQHDQPSKFADTYRRVLPTALLLSISGDGVCKKLYHSLMFQTARWFSGGPTRVHEAESVALVECIMDGLCDANNAKLRSMCADLVAEYFQWTLKQASKADIAKHPETIDNLLSRLLVLAAHSAEEKRLGAARAFSKIYRIFRSETSIVHRFALRILYVLLKSLKLGATETTLQECSRAAQKFEEMIVKMVEEYDDRAALLRRSDVDRGYPHTLSDLVLWLWREGVGSSDKYFRRSCMQTFNSLCPLLPRESSSSSKAAKNLKGFADTVIGLSLEQRSQEKQKRLQEFVSDYMDGKYVDVTQSAAPAKGISALVHVIEQSSPSGTMTNISSKGDLLALNAAVDAYHWLIKSRYLDLSVFLEMFAKKGGSRVSDSGGGGDSSSPSIFQRLKLFIDHCSAASAGGSAGGGSGGGGSLTVTGVSSSTGDAIDSDADADGLLALQPLRAEVLRRTLQLFTSIVMVTKESGGDARDVGALLRTQGLWDSESFSLITDVVLKPKQCDLFSSSSSSTIKSDQSSQEVDLYIPTAIEQLLLHLDVLDPPDTTTAPSKGRSSSISSFRSHIWTVMQELLDDLKNMRLSSEEISRFMRMHSILSNCDLVLLAYQGGGGGGAGTVAKGDVSLHDTAYVLLTAAAKLCASAATQITPAVRDSADKLVQVSIALGLPLVAPSFIEDRHDKRTASCDEGVLQASIESKTVISVLCAPEHAASGTGMALVEHFSGSLVRVVLGDSGAAFSKHGRAFLHCIAESKGEACFTVLQKLLVDVVATVLAEAEGVSVGSTMSASSVQEFVSVCMSVLFPADLPSDQLLSFTGGSFSAASLLEIDAKCPRSHRNEELHRRMTRAVLDFLMRASSSSSSSTGSKSSSSSQAPSAKELAECLRLLPYLISGIVPGCPRHLGAFTDNQSVVNEVIAVLEELAAEKFPLDSMGIDPKSPQGKEYRLLLKAYFDAFASCGAPCLLVPLLPTLREGPRHRYHKWVIGAMKAVATAATSPSLADLLDVTMSSTDDAARTVPPSSSSSSFSSPSVLLTFQEQTDRLTALSTSILAAICGMCLNVAEDVYEFIDVKKTLFDHLCLPTLQSCSPEVLVKLMATETSSVLSTKLTQALQAAVAAAPFSTAVASNAFVKHLHGITQQDVSPTSPVAGDADKVNSLAFFQACAYSIFQLVYDRCSLDSIKTEVHNACLGPAHTGKELTLSLSKSAHTKVLRTPTSSAIIQETSQRLFSSAYNFLLMAMAKSQTVESLFDNLLFKEKPGDNTWRRIVDCTTDYQFLTNSGKFDVVMLAGGDASTADAGYVTRRARGNRPGGTRGRGGYMTQYLSGSLLEGSSLVASQSQAVLTRRTTATSRAAHAAGGRRVITGASQSQSQSQGGGMLSQVDGIDELLWGKPAAGGSGSGSKGPSAYGSGGGAGRAASAGANYSQAYDAFTASQLAENPEAALAKAVAGLDDTVISFELNDVNKQPCMASLVRVITRMNVLFNQPSSASGGGGAWRDDVLPLWVSTIRDRLADYSDSTGSRNIRLFMLRLLLNQPIAAIVARWSAQLLPAVLECCLRDLCQSDVGTGYHYFLRDVVFTLCDSWAANISAAKLTGSPDSDDPFAAAVDVSTVKQCGRLAARLLSYLIYHTYDDDSEILRDNVRSIGALIRLWTTASSCDAAAKNKPSSLIFLGSLYLGSVMNLLVTAAGPTGGAHAAKTSRGAEGVKKRLAGLSILRVLLESGYPLLCDPGDDDNNDTVSVSSSDQDTAIYIKVRVEHILNAVLDCVKFQRKEVSELGSTVSGLILKTVHEDSEKRSRGVRVPSHLELAASCTDFEQLLQQRLEAKTLVKGGPDSAATSLCAVSRSAPEFMQRAMMMKMMYVFRRLTARSKFEFLLALDRSNSPSIHGSADAVIEQSSSSSAMEVTEGGSQGSGSSSLSAMTVIGFLRPFIPSLLGDLSTVVMGRSTSIAASAAGEGFTQEPSFSGTTSQGYEDSAGADSPADDSDITGDATDRQQQQGSSSFYYSSVSKGRLPMVQVLTLQLLLRHAKRLDLEVIEQLLQLDGKGAAASDNKSSSSGAEGGLGLVLNDKAVLHVRERAYGLLLELCQDHPIIGLKVVTSPRSSDDDSRVAAIRKGIISLLLRGLTDPDRDGMDEDYSGPENSQEEDEDTGALTGGGDDPMVPVKSRRVRVGIRRRVFDFFDQNFGLGTDPYQRLNVLMTQLFDSTRTDFWLHYTSYLLLALSKDTPAYRRPLFNENLAEESAFSPMHLKNQLSSTTGSYYTASQGGGAGDASSLPLFSLERTQHTLALASQSQKGIGPGLAAYSQSQAGRFAGWSQSSQSQVGAWGAGGGYGTQSRDTVSRQSGFIRGTQEVAWTQTQTQSPFAIGSSGATAAGKVRQAAFRDPLSTQALFAHVGSGKPSSGGSNASMAPPVGLPMYFKGRPVAGAIAQRVPRRFNSRGTATQTQASQSAQATQSSHAPSTLSQQSAAAVDSSQQYKSSSSSASGTYNFLSYAARAAKKAEEDRIKRSKVVMYRRYREGELPDIRLPLSALLRPLQGLCLRDSNTASTVFRLLFDALYGSLPSLQSSHAAAMRTGLQQLLTYATANNTQFVATLLGTALGCLKSEDPRSSPNSSTADASLGLGGASSSSNLLVHTSATVIAEASIRSLNFHGGIQFIEEQMLIAQRRVEASLKATVKASKKGNAWASAAAGGSRKRGAAGDDPPSSSSSSSSSSLSIVDDAELERNEQLRKNMWRQLARLYEMLGESDVLLGLAERMSSFPKETSRAIDAEVSGDYRKAVSLYGDLLESARKGAENKELLQKKKPKVRKGTAGGARGGGQGGGRGGGSRKRPKVESRRDDSGGETSDTDVDGDDGDNDRDDDSDHGSDGGRNEEEGSPLLDSDLGILATEDEVSMWTSRSLDCLRQLCDWGQLHESVEGLAESAAEANMAAFDRNPSAARTAQTIRDQCPGGTLIDIMNSVATVACQDYSHEVLDMVSDEDRAVFNDRSRVSDRLLSSYITALTHGGSQDDHELSIFVDSAFATAAGSATDAVRVMLEERYTADLASFFAQRGDWARVRVYTDRALTQFTGAWRGLHPCAIGARQKLLQTLQRSVELDDTGLCMSSSSVIANGSLGSAAAASLGGAGSSITDTRVAALLRQWSRSSPAVTDPIWLWDEITCSRKVAFIAASRRPDSMEVDDEGNDIGGASSLSVQAAWNLSRSYVATACAAAHQGILQAVKPQLEASNAMKRVVFGKSRLPTLSMAEVGAVYAFNKSNIDLKLRQSLAEATGVDDNVVNELSTMFGRTLILLDKKSEQLQDQISSEGARVQSSKRAIAGAGGAAVTVTADKLVAELSDESEAPACLRSVQMMKGDWLSDWSSVEKKYANNEDSSQQWINRCYSAVQAYASAAAVPGRGRRDALIRPMGPAEVADTLRMRSSAYGKLAKLTDALLRTLTEGNAGADVISELQETVGNDENLAVQVVSALVNGIQLGDSYCRDRLLRLADLAGRYPSAAPQLLDKLKSIPAWVFLRYAPQLMGYLDLPSGEAAAAILEKVAKVYPKALYHPFHITAELLGPQGRRLAQRSGGLDQLLQDPVMGCFVEALHGLTHPELRWNDGTKALKSAYNKIIAARTASTKGQSQSSAQNLQQLQLQLVEIYRQFAETSLETKWKQVGEKIGSYNRRFAREWRAKAQALVGVAGEKLANAKAVKQLVDDDDFKADVRSVKFGAGKVPLFEFSEWLCDLDASLRIEVPGQYSAQSDRPPNTEHHDIIVGVDPQLLVMTSIRKPKRIKFFASSGSETMFLVKGGEDLRNDERIEQLFLLMNSVISQASAAASVLPMERGGGGGSSAGVEGAGAGGFGQFRGLKARTYTVIPMTSKVGILEWVKNTIPIKAVIAEEMGKDASFCTANPDAVQDGGDDGQGKKRKDVEGASIGAGLTRTSATKMRGVMTEGLESTQRRQMWLSDLDNNYHNMLKASSNQARGVYKSMADVLPDDFIRRRLLQMAVGPEAFITLRTEFAKSVAMSSIFGYILGIGDRHLENLLLDSRTGAIVQIDFGVCFGIGASMLPVPELIPFRLSPQIRGVLQPLDSIGLLRRYMVQALTCLRAEEGMLVLANALEVYVNDPVLDWYQRPIARRHEESVAVAAAAAPQTEGKKRGGRGKSTQSQSQSQADDASTVSSSSGSMELDSLEREQQEQMAALRDDPSWEPRRRVQGSVRKLLGVSPAKLLLEELSINRTVKSEKSFDALANIINTACGDAVSVNDTLVRRADATHAPAAAGGKRGRSSGSQSASQGGGKRSGGASMSAADTELPVESQVDALIALATDPNIVVRQWLGLIPWI